MERELLQTAKESLSLVLKSLREKGIGASNREYKDMYNMVMELTGISEQLISEGHKAIDTLQEAMSKWSK